ncbi:DUF4062 domain-containing protein [Microbacterium sp. T2.11-28]|uniref:DUF4062 domain-containing protein n=1 Tax=Microbacterium sp. T2.11-28 TaxID=3041169 RepID=UPI002477CB38|nr:DUF4062 domain-containing protein [Microbacterium sp. T2.11-28]CAI9394003.1 hypothetical protein MICABA_02642 [Microbacterium sp. T2.11-28]
MRVFISSVRAGLEDEREALPGLIRALEHTPVRFEDFSAQKVPSREACVAAVADSDVYILLLGPHYGYRFPETGQSATNDEWRAARQAGLQIYVFRKSGVAFDADQEEFAQEVGEYGSGRFWKTFTTTTELQQGVVEAIRDAQNRPAALDFAPLGTLVQPGWVSDRDIRSRDPRFEVRVLPVADTPTTDRVFRQAAQRLAAMLRSENVISQLSGLTEHDGVDTFRLSSSDDGPRAGWNSVRPSRFDAASIDKSGQFAVTFVLPADQMGSFLDRDDAVQNVTRALRLTDRMEYVSTARCAVALRVTGAPRVTVGPVPSASRSSMSIPSREEAIQLLPDESIPTAALGSAAHEVAVTTVDTLLSRLR